MGEAITGQPVPEALDTTLLTNLMHGMNQNLFLFSPETVLTICLVLLFLTDAFLPKLRNSILSVLIIVAGCILASYFTYGLPTTPTLYFSGLLTSDGFSHFFRYLIFLSCGLCAIAAYGSKEFKLKGKTEFGILLICTTFGLSLMVMASHLLSLYLAIETVSIVSFAMAGLSRNNLKSNEASFKYLVFGALGSGLMIYGLSLLYGYTGSLEYAKIATYLTQNTKTMPQFTILSLALVYAGLAYKISAFPMHFWTPDVYEGAPNPVVTFFSVGPKIAGFAALIRFFLTVCATKTAADGKWIAIDGIPLVQALAVLAAITMVIGNFSALGQTNVKRILAYSSIAHVGYMMMGMVALDTDGISAVLFYLVAYCIMNIGAFWIVGIVSDIKGDETLDAFKGVGWTMPVLGTCMAIFLFSLTGIPMFSGFIGKFLLFGAVLKTPGFLWLAILGVLNSVVSLYYYSKILRAMYFENSQATEAIALPLYYRLGLIALAAPTIILGLFFTPVIEFVKRSVLAFL